MRWLLGGHEGRMGEWRHIVTISVCSYFYSSLALPGFSLAFRTQLTLYGFKYNWSEKSCITYDFFSCDIAIYIWSFKMFNPRICIFNNNWFLLQPEIDFRSIIGYDKHILQMQVSSICSKQMKHNYAGSAWKSTCSCSVCGIHTLVKNLMFFYLFWC